MKAEKAMELIFLRETDDESASKYEQGAPEFYHPPKRHPSMV